MVYWLVVKRKRVGEDAITLNYAISNLNISRSSDNSNSTATITFSNSGGELINKSSSEIKQFEDTISFDDQITIALSNNPIDPDNINKEEKIFIGLVTEVSASMNGSSFNFKVKCTDLTDLLLAKAYVGRYQAETASDMVENLVAVANDNVSDNENKIKTPNATGGNPTGGYIETTTPTNDFYSNYKKISELIKEVSVPSFTGVGRNATYYIDDERNFYWFFPKDGGSTTLSSGISNSATSIPVTDVSIFTEAGGLVTIGGEIVRYDSISGSNLILDTVEGRGVSNTSAQSHASGATISNLMRIEVPFKGTGIGRVLQAGFNTNTDDVVNMLIMRLGTDLRNNKIVWYKYNEQSTTSNIRMKVVDRQDIGDAFYRSKQGDVALVVSAYNSSASTITLDSSASTYPSTNGYIKINGEIISYTTKTASGSNYNFTGLSRAQLNTSIVDNVQADTEAIDWTDISALSNTDVRTAIRNEGIAFAESFFAGVREKLTFNVVIEGTKIQPNEFVNLTLEDIGINQALVRVKEVQHNITRNQWTTQLKLEEDDVEITV